MTVLPLESLSLFRRKVRRTIKITAEEGEKGIESRDRRKRLACKNSERKRERDKEQGLEVARCWRRAVDSSS